MHVPARAALRVGGNLKMATFTRNDLKRVRSLRVRGVKLLADDLKQQKTGSDRCA